MKRVGVKRWMVVLLLFDLPKRLFLGIEKERRPKSAENMRCSHDSFMPLIHIFIFILVKSGPICNNQKRKLHHVIKKKNI